MIKAKKSLILTLVAAMMIFAFGATASFANVVKSDGVAVTGAWADDYSTVTVNKTEYKAVRTWDPATGMIKASLDDEDMTPAVRANVPLVDDVYFYDLTGAQLASNGTALVSTYDKASFEALFKTGSDGVIDSLVLTAPSYVDNYADLTKTQKTYKGGLVGWTVSAKQPADYDSAALTDQKFTIVGIIESQDADGTATKPYRVDENVISKDVTVKGSTQTAADVKFFKDEVSEKTTDAIEAGAVAFTYDGAAHKVVNNVIADFPVAWTVLNTKTGKYEAASECPSVTNVGDTATVKATITWTETTTSGSKTVTETKKIEKKFELSVTANKTAKPTFSFDKDGNKAAYQYAVEGSEYDVYSYVVVSTASEKDVDKDAVKANEAELLAYFKDFYDVNAENTKANPEKFALTATAKKLTDAQKKELEKKYEVLLKNFGGVAPAFTTDAKAGLTAELFINNSEMLVPEIEFVDSPTFFKAKAKKLKKKATSFTVTAVATNGAAVSYKLINAPEKITIDKATGTITLAKKLKKGTYKIKVKAYMATTYFDKNGNAFYPTETHDIKIKVKK